MVLSVREIGKLEESSEKIKVHGLITHCAFNYDRDLVQIRCPKCYKEIFKGKCSTHTDVSGIPTLSGFYVVLKDDLTDDTISCYPSASFWDHMDLGKDLSTIVEEQKKGSLDVSEIRQILIENLLMRECTMSGRLSIREWKTKNGGEDSRTVKMFLAADAVFDEPNLEDVHKNIQKSFEILLKETEA